VGRRRLRKNFGEDTAYEPLSGSLQRGAPEMFFRSLRRLAELQNVYKACVSEFADVVNRWRLNCFLF